MGTGQMTFRAMASLFAFAAVAGCARSPSPQVAATAPIVWARSDGQLASGPKFEADKAVCLAEATSPGSTAYMQHNPFAPPAIDFAGQMGRIGDNLERAAARAEREDQAQARANAAAALVNIRLAACMAKRGYLKAAG